jgi:hypothetical protein
MPNVSLNPAKKNFLKDLIADTEDGTYIVGWKLEY